MLCSFYEENQEYSLVLVRVFRPFYIYFALLKNALFLFFFWNVLELYRKKSAQPEHVVLLECQQQFTF